MESKFMFLVLVNLVISFVNGRFEPPTEAMDNTLYEEVLNEELCAEQMNIVRRNLPLAMQFADAGIRVPKGILQGNTRDMGNYHQCINYDYPLSNSRIQGKYCVIRVPTDQNLALPGLSELSQFSLPSNFQPSIWSNETLNNLKQYNIMKRGIRGYTGIIDNSPLPGLELTLAVCVPKPCTTRQAFDSYLFNVSQLGFDYSDVYCRLRNDKPWATVDYVAIAVFSLLGVVTLISTSYDLWATFLKKTGKSFSLYTNGRRLMTFTSSPDSIECIDGIRALAMAWVVLGHTFSTESLWANPIDTYMFSTSWKSLWVTGAHFAVDTFIALSGFLVCYTTVGKLTSSGLIKNLHLFYLHRLLRLFPLLATVVLLEASYLNHMTDGPNWAIVAGQVNNCRATWWSTLLHIQNYMTPTQVCMIQSWYLAIDVQLHILSPIILVWVLGSNKKIAWTALGLGLFSVLTAATIYNFIKNFPPVMVAAGREHEMMDYVVNYYINTLPRAAPFFVGMIFGYLARDGPKVKLAKMAVVFFWISFFAFTTFLIYTGYPITQVFGDNQLLINIYNSFIRSFWALAVCSLIYACKNGFAGPINWFLSLQVWKIHARLSYAIYLFHYMLMIGINYTAVTPIFLSTGLTVFKFLGHYVFSFAVSFFMTLIVDAPFSTLFKLVLGGGAKAPRKKVDKCNETRPKINKKDDDNS